MGNVDVTQLRKLIDEAITQWEAGGSADVSPEPTAAVEDKRPRTDGKRAVRTKTSGDRVFLIDDNAKTKAWITSQEILNKLGFEIEDVQDLPDEELISYQQVPSIYRIDE